MTKAVTLTADMPIQVGQQLEIEARRGNSPVIVRSIPLCLFTDAHERQCQRNHSQTLERIRERGGFGAMEAVAVLSCLHWQHTEMLKNEHAHYVLYSMIATTNRGMRIAEASVRDEVAKLYCAAGCSCCRNDEAWEAASERLGELLGVPRYDDGSSVDWYSARDRAQA